MALRRGVCRFRSRHYAGAVTLTALLLAGALLAGPAPAAEATSHHDGPRLLDAAFTPHIIEPGQPVSVRVHWEGSHGLWHIVGELVAESGDNVPSVSFNCDFRPVTHEHHATCHITLPPAAHGHDFRLAWLWLEDGRGQTFLAQRGSGFPEDNVTRIRHVGPVDEGRPPSLLMLRLDQVWYHPGDIVKIRVVASGSAPLTRAAISLGNASGTLSTQACRLDNESYVDVVCAAWLPADTEPGLLSIAGVYLEDRMNRSVQLAIDRDYRAGLAYDARFHVFAPGDEPGADQEVLVGGPGAQTNGTVEPTGVARGDGDEPDGSTDNQSAPPGNNGAPAPATGLLVAVIVAAALATGRRRWRP